MPEGYNGAYTGQQIDEGIAKANGALPQSGGVMTGPLSLAGDPAGENEATRKAYVDNVTQAVQSNLTAHTGNTNNPHGVTAEQVGARPNTWMPSAAEVGAATVDLSNVSNEVFTSKASSAGVGGGKQYATIVVGTSTSGHTASEVDYLCDGNHDQSEINAAIQALPTEGGKILILEGDYVVGGNINLNKDNVCIEGMGRGSKLILSYAVSGFGGAITITADYCSLYNLTFAGSSQFTGSSQNGVCINGGQYYHVDHCKFIGLYGDGVSNSSTNSYGEITNNIVVDCTYYGIYAGGYSVAANNVVVNCSTGIYGTDIVVANNFVRNCKRGIYSPQGVACITGNKISNNAKRGIAVGSSRGKGCSVISNNHISGSEYSIYLEDGIDDKHGYFSVNGNCCIDFQIGGIEIGCNNCAITGNSFKLGTGATYTIHLTSTATGNVVLGNIVTGKAVTNEGTGNTVVNNKS